MTLQRLNPSTVAAPIGAYSHATEAPATGRWLHVSGQVGLRPDGTLPPGFEDQAKAAWDNVAAVLSAAGMGPADLVKLTVFLTDGAQVALHAPIRARFLGDAKPASTLLVVAALARPEFLVEVEAIAWRT